MHSDPILIHLLEFGSILSIFQGFSSERRKCAFFCFTCIPNLFSPICSSLVEFCPFFTDFRQKDVNAHFMLHMYSDAICKHLLEFGSLLVIFHGFSTKTRVCAFFRSTCILTIFAPDWFTSDHFSRIFDRNTCMCIFSLYMYFLAICLRAVPPVSYFSKSQRNFFYINGRYHQMNNFVALNVFRNLFHGLARVWFIFVHFSRLFDKKT